MQAYRLGSVRAPRRGGTLTFAIDSYPQDMNLYSPTADITSLAVFGAWWEYLVRPTQAELVTGHG